MSDWNRDDTFLARWLNNELTPDELREFEASDDFEHYRQIKDTMADVSSLNFDTEAEWDRLKMARTPPKVRKLGSVYRWAAAASILLILGIGVVYQWQTKKDVPFVAETLAMAKSSVDLPDGSDIKLNSESSISYDPKSWDEERVVRLSGEAFFKVKKGQTFTVATPSGGVEVLGTSFNVKERNGVFDVLCFTGKVHVSSHGSSLILEKGDGVRFQKGQDPISLAVSGTTPSWTQGIVSLQSVNMIQVFDEFKRQYGYELTLPEFDASKLVGISFPTDDLETALSQITGPLDLVYSISEDQKHVTISYK